MILRTITRSWLILVCLFAACVDTDPGQFEATDRDAGGLDGALTDSGNVESCRRCVSDEGAPCRAVYDSCLQIPKCPVMIECLLKFGCFTFPELQGRLDCGLPCADDAGGLVGSDPAIIVLGELNLCTFDACSEQCTGDPAQDN